MFFTSERPHFFRPLTNKYRELAAACLRSLYDRLHGPAADYSQALTRDALRELFLPVILEHKNVQAPDGVPSEDDGGALDNADPNMQALALVRLLLREGWLETFGDRAGLVTAYRFTRAGKLFSEALWSIDRPRARTRQRNMRSCRNALAMALANNQAYDLVDAYEYAESVISDLAEGVDYFQDLVRRLMVEASGTPWDEFMEFLDRFEREFKKQFTADNVERHRQVIRETLSRLRGLEEVRVRAFEAELNDVARWAVQEKTCDSTFDWFLQRIEEMVEVACNTKQPELIKAMNVYMRRAGSIVQQAMMLRTGSTRPAYTAAIARVQRLQGEVQGRFLEAVGRGIAASSLRLLDPGSFKLRTLSARRRALTVTRKPVVTREARLAAAQAHAEAGAFALSNEDVLLELRQEVRRFGGAVRLSSLPIKTALDVLSLMQAVEAVRSSKETGLKATLLPNRIHTEFYSGADYLIEISHEPQ